MNCVTRSPVPVKLRLLYLRNAVAFSGDHHILAPVPTKKSGHSLDSRGIYFIRRAREAYRSLEWQTHRYTLRLSPVYMLHHVRRAQGNPHCRKKCNHRLTPPLPANFWKHCFAPSRRITTSAFGRCQQSAASQSSEPTSAGPSRI